MSTPRPGGRRFWWLVPEFAALALLSLALVAFPIGDAPPSDVQVAAAQLAAQLVERSSPAEHHQHGHEVAVDDRVYCAVDVFGIDPSSASVIADVRTIYGYYFCAVGRPGVPYLLSSRTDGPIVVSVTNPPTVQIAAPGADYQERVRAMMPDQYEDLCFSGLPDPSVAEEVKRRYESEVDA